MDGVLLDSEKVALRSWLEVNEASWHLKDLDKHYTRFIGRNQADGLELMKSIYGEDINAQKFFVECRQHLADLYRAEGIPVKEGAFEILTFLKEKNIPVALCSGTDADRIRKNLELTGLSPFFQEIIGGDMVPHGKPDPDCYLISCKRLGLDPKECLGVEDSPNGLRALRSAGLYAVMIPDLVAPTKELRLIADRVEESLLTLLEFLKTELSLSE